MSTAADLRTLETATQVSCRNLTETQRAAALAAANEAFCVDPPSFATNAAKENFAAFCAEVLNPTPLPERTQNFVEKARRKAIDDHAAVALFDAVDPALARHALEFRARRDSSFGTSEDSDEVVDVIRQVDALLRAVKVETQRSKDSLYHPGLTDEQAKPFAEPKAKPLAHPADDEVLAIAGER